MSRRSRFGETFENAIQWFVVDLQDDEKDPGLIVETVRHEFGFEGDEFEQGLRAILLALTQAGARPAQYSRGTPEVYIPLPCYGETPEEITYTLMRHLRESGYPERHMAGCILVLPEWFNNRRTAEDIAREEEEGRETRARHELIQKQRQSRTD